MPALRVRIPQVTSEEWLAIVESGVDQDPFDDINPIVHEVRAHIGQVVDEAFFEDQELGHRMNQIAAGIQVAESGRRPSGAAS